MQKTRAEIQKAYNNIRAGERAESASAMARQGPPTPPGFGGPAISLRNGFDITATDLAGVTRTQYAPPPSARDTDTLATMPTIKVPAITPPKPPATSIAPPPKIVTPDANTDLTSFSPGYGSYTKPPSALPESTGSVGTVGTKVRYS